MRTIASFTNQDQSRSARVLYDRDNQEYVTKFYDNGEWIVNGDYFSDDKYDAEATAKVYVDNIRVVDDNGY